MNTLLRKLVRDIRHRGLRNFLTLLAVILGVAGVVTISSTTRTLAIAQRLTYNEANQADIAVFASGISESTRSLLSRQDNVNQVASRTVLFTRLSTGAGWVNLRLDGIDNFETMDIETIEISQGTYPGQGEIVLDESARELTPFEIGDTVAVQSSPAEQPTYLTISGLTRSPAVLGAGILNRATGYATARTVRNLTGRTLDNFLLVRVDDKQRASETSEQIGQLLNMRGVSTGAFDIRDPEHFVGSRELNTLLFLLRLFSFLGAILSGFLVANTISAVLSEETQQIGILKALGASRRQVVSTYLIYAAGIGILGAILGTIAGLAMSQFLSQFLLNLTGLRTPPFAIFAADIALALGVGLAVTVVAALIPALAKANARAAGLLSRRASQSAIETRLLSRITSLVGRIHTAIAAGLRNIGRRRAPSFLTIALVAVAVGAFLSTQALSQSVNTTVDNLYALYGADGWIYFDKTTDLAIVDDLKRQPAVVDAEAWSTASAAIGTTRTDIWGMPAVDPMYDYQLVEGRWVGQASPAEAVVTSNLAREKSVNVGQVLDLDVGRQRIQVQVVGIVNDSSTYLGSTATGKVFMRLRDLNRITGREGRTDIIALQFWSSDHQTVDSTLEMLETRYRDLQPGTLAAYADQQSARRAIDILSFLLRAMVVVVGIVGLAGIINTLLIGITERRREYGIMRAIGGRTRHILMLLVTEGITLAIIGTVVGLVIGYPISRFVVDLTGAQLFELDYELNLVNLGAVLALAIVTVGAASAGPGLLASKLLPARVLRYE